MQNVDDVMREGVHAGVSWNQAALQEQRMSTASFSSPHCFEGAGYCLPLPLHCSPPLSLSLHQKGQNSRQRSRSLIGWGLLPEFSFASLSYFRSAQSLFFYTQLKDSSVSLSCEDYQSLCVCVKYLAAFERGTCTGEPPSLDVVSASPYSEQHRLKGNRGRKSLN